VEGEAAEVRECSDAAPHFVCDVVAADSEVFELCSEGGSVGLKHLRRWL
jgi:hypothetical protein